MLSRAVQGACQRSVVRTTACCFFEYDGRVSYAGRGDKTRDKTRRGGLPAPTAHTQLVGHGDGRPCDGCGETIHPSETASLVSVHQALDWRFHDGCYEAWSSFKRDL